MERGRGERGGRGKEGKWESGGLDDKMNKNMIRGLLQKAGGREVEGK